LSDRVKDLPTRFDPRPAESRWYGAWLDADLFRASVDDSREPFSIVIPPPNVTGVLHLGHALNSSLQDTLARHERMRGKNVLWLPGTDHAGIATQVVVERELSERGKTSRRSAVPATGRASGSRWIRGCRARFARSSCASTKRS
jgi:valyl-tRNA synthetase